MHIYKVKTLKRGKEETKLGDLEDLFEELVKIYEKMRIFYFVCIMGKITKCLMYLKFYF